MRSTQSCRYFALSYVWGKVHIPKTVRANLSTRLAKGGLPQNLPVTIEDAMTLVAELGERYLWVDSLCIIQDDAFTKHRDIKNMHIIYNRAVATMVALSGGDADAGLPGVRPGTRAPQRIEMPASPEKVVEPNSSWIREYDRLAATDREKHQFRTTCRNIGAEVSCRSFLEYLMDAGGKDMDKAPLQGPAAQEILGIAPHPPSLKYALRASTWDTRGWTMQERFLSGRCIYFSPDYVYFQCGESTLCETGGNILTWATVHASPGAGNEARVAAAMETNPLLHFKRPAPAGMVEYDPQNEYGAFVLGNISMCIRLLWRCTAHGNSHIRRTSCTHLRGFPL